MFSEEQKMDQKALLNRKKQMLAPYTNFVMRMFQKFKGTEHESLYSIMYETITNDRKILTNPQIDTMKAKLLDLQLKAIPFMQKSTEGDQQSGSWFNGAGKQVGNANQGEDDLFRRRGDSRPYNARKFFRKEFFTRNNSVNGRDEFKDDYGSKGSSPASGTSETKGSQHHEMFFHRRNAAADHHETPPRASRSPTRESNERARDPRLNKDPRVETDRSDSVSRDSRTNNDKSVDSRFDREKSRDPRLDRAKSRDPRLDRDKSRDPRVNRDKSRDPWPRRSTERSTSREKIDHRRNERDPRSQHKSTGGWFNSKTERHQPPGNSKHYSNKGWFNGSREQGASERYRSRSPHHSRPRSRSSSPQMRNQPQKQFWNYKDYKNYKEQNDRSRSRSKAANTNSRFNKSMPRSPPRYPNSGGHSFATKRPQSQGRAQTVQIGADIKRVDSDPRERPKVHHGMLRDIKEFLVEKKKPPPRRMSCYTPKEPEVVEKPQSFMKIRQLRMSCFESKEPEVIKKPETFGKIRQRRMSLLQSGDDAKAPTSSKDLYPKASEISVGNSKAIVAAKKILSTKHAEPDDIAKHLVDVFGPELFIAALKRKIGSDTKDDESTKVSSKDKVSVEVKDGPAVKEPPPVPAVKEPPPKAALTAKESPQAPSKAARPTKVIQLSMDEVRELSKAAPPQENLVDKKTKAVQLSKAERSVPVTPREQKSIKKRRNHRNSSESKPGPKKSKRDDDDESWPVRKPKQPEKVIKSFKNDDKVEKKPQTMIKDKEAEPSTSTTVIPPDAEPDQVAPEPSKKKKRKETELDKLHAQISDFFDGSDIASFGSKRSCTKQPHNYKGEQSSAESSQNTAKETVSPALAAQLALHKIKHLKISLRRMSLDGVEMPVKLDSQDQPIIPKQRKSIVKSLPPASPAIKQKKFSKVVTETPPVVVKKSPKAQPADVQEPLIVPYVPAAPPKTSQVASKRGSIWGSKVSPKKPKIDPEDNWEDVADNSRPGNRKSVPHKKVLLKVLANCMDSWSKLIKKKTKFEVNSEIAETETQTKSAFSTKEKNRHYNFTIVADNGGALSYQCQLCLFKSLTTSSFIGHIKAKHSLVHYPKQCPKCDITTDGTMESEFKHMLTHYVIKASYTVVPKDRLPTVSQATTSAPTKTAIVMPSFVKPSASRVPISVPPKLQLVGTNHRSGSSSSSRATMINVPTTAQLKILPMPNTAKPAIPVNMGLQSKIIPTKVYKIWKPAAAPEPPATGSVQQPPKKLPVATALAQLNALNSLKGHQTVEGRFPQSQNAEMREEVESPNLQFYSDQEQTIPKIFIQPMSTDKLLRPWLNETSAKSTEISQEMLRDQKCLAAMFKCMASTCSFYSSNLFIFEKHLKLHQTYQKADKVNYLACAYCNFRATTAGGLTEHIVRSHGYDRYQCSYCFYRAYNDFHVFLNHQQTHHKMQLRALIECSNTMQREFQMGKMQELMTKNVPVLKCFHCLGRFYIESSFLEHLRSHEDKVVDYTCRKCTKRVNIDNVLEHFMCHGFGHFQCIYCSFGATNFATMDEHVAVNHSSELPFVAQRVFSRNASDPLDVKSLSLKRISKSGKTCMRINFKPQELTNEENVNQLHGRNVQERSQVAAGSVSVSQPENTVTAATVEVVATTNAESAGSLMISSVRSLADNVTSHANDSIVLSDEDE